MIRWEYCQINYVFNPMLGDKATKKIVVFPTPSLEKFETKEIQDVNTTLAQLGMEGWELVSHTQTFAGSGNMLMAGNQVFYLKRPLPE